MVIDAEHTGRARYPGSVPFDDNEVDRHLFFGRDTDADEILHSILSHDLFVLYARSGIGKTSLLRARVMGELRERGLWPVVVRLNLADRDPVELVREALQRQQREGEVEVVGADRSETSLWDLLAWVEIWREEELQVPVLIFDQFEEIFTRLDDHQRQRFVDEFASVVRGVPLASGVSSSTRPAVDVLPRFKIVLSLREDFLGDMDVFTELVPQVLAHRYRLEPLSRDQAGRAIRRPAALTEDDVGGLELASPPFEYTPGAVDRILDVLSGRIRDGEAVRSNEVEAFQLQVICHYIEDTILPPKIEAGRPAVIEASDLEDDHAPNRILTNFYQREVELFDSRAERARIERLCERGLITKTGRRDSLDRQRIEEEFGVSPEQLESLVQRRLLRAEPRLDSVYYELAHDSLVEPLQSYRAERQKRQRRNLLIGAAAVAALVLSVVVFFATRQFGGQETVETVPVAQSVAIGGSVQEPISAGEPVREFAINGEPGQIVTVTLESVDPSEADAGAPVQGDFRGVLGVRSRAVEEIGRAEAAPREPARATFRLPDTGTDVVSVAAADGANGTYRLSVAETDVNTLEPGADEADERRSLEPGGAVVYTISGSPSTTATFTIEAEDSLTGAIEVIADTTTRVEYIGASGPGVDAELTTFPATEDGAIVIVRAAPDAEGELDIAWQRGTRRTVGAAGDADSIPADLGDEPGAVDVYRFDDRRGDVVSVRMTPDAAETPLDASFEIRDSTGAVIERIDAAGPGAIESRTLIRPVVDGMSIWASGTNSGGAYTIDIVTSEVSPLIEGSSRSGAVGGSPDVEVFELSGERGDAVVVSVEPDAADDDADPIDASLELIGPGGGRVTLIDAVGAGGSEAATLALPEDGTYYALVRSNVAEPGGFQIGLDLPEVRPLDDGDPVSDDLDGERTGEQDLYSLAADPGDAITVTLEPESSDGTDLDAVVEILDPSARRIAYSDSRGSGGTESSTLVTQTGGTFLVRASPTRDFGGGYTIRARSSSVEEIDEAGSFEREIEEASEVDVYSIDGTAGEAVSLVVDPSGGDLNAVIEVLDAESNRVERVDAEGDGGAETTTIVVPVDGRFTVLVSGFVESTGGYRFEVMRSAVGPLPLGTQQTRPIGTGGTEVFSFEARADDVDTLTVEPVDPSLDVSFELRGPDGETLERIDAAGAGEIESTTVALSDEGTYFVVVRGFSGSGTFTASVARSALVALDGTEAQGVRVDDTGALEFEGRAEESVTITVTPGGQFDPVFEVLDPDGRSIAEVDARPIGQTESENLVLPAGGRYVVLVGGFNRSAGSYDVVLDRADVVELDGTVQGSIDGERQIDVYRFEGLVNQRVELQFEPVPPPGDGTSDEEPAAGLIPLIEIVQPAPYQRINTGVTDTTVIFTLPGNGVYYVKVSGTSGTTGPYQLSLVELPT